MSDFIVIVLFFIFLILFIIFSYYEGKREGLISSAFVFGIGSFFYYLSIPFEQLVFNLNKSYMGYDIDDFIFLRIFIFGTLAYVSFVKGYQISGLNRKYKAFLIEDKNKNKISPFGFLTIAFFSTVILIIFFWKLILESKTYVGAYTAKYTNWAFSYILQISIISYVILGNLFIDQKQKKVRLFGYIILILVITWGIYSSDKDPILMVSLCAVVNIFKKIKVSRVKIFCVFILVILIMGIFNVIFSLYRAKRIGEIFSYIKSPIIFSRSDARGPMISLIEIIESPLTPKLGVTLIRGLLLWIPRFIWPSRPLDLAQEYAMIKIKNWQPGQGLGFSLLSESYLNFWLLGPIIQYLIIGYLWGKLWILILKLFCPKRKYLMIKIYQVYGYYLLIIMHRGPFSGIVTSIMQFLFVIITAIIIDSIFLSNKKKTHLISALNWNKINLK